MNEKQVNELDFRDIFSLDDLSRRSFLKTLGGGIIIFFTLGGMEVLEAQQRGGGRGLPADFNAFLRIGKDGHVTGYTGKIEMGQGPITSLAQDRRSATPANRTRFASAGRWDEIVGYWAAAIFCMTLFTLSA